MSEQATNHSDLRLMELAARNPSLGGRELLQEIIERGSTPEANERPQARDAFAAFASHELDHPDYRTPVEQANWLHTQSPTQRDLYERGATLKSDTLIVPAEEFELDEEREQPFITTLTYALRKLGDPEQAREFHALAHTISGQYADARTQIAVFKNYYDQLGRRGNFTVKEEKTIALSQTLAEMRTLAAEMEKLETRESTVATPLNEDREDEGSATKFNATAHRLSLREKALRLPAGLSYEQKERLITVTIPEIDRRLELGIRRDTIFSAIDHTLRQPDLAGYRNKLVALVGKAEDENPGRAVSKEEYFESQRTLLELSEHEARRLQAVRATRANKEWEPHEGARFQQVNHLARRIKQGLGKDELSNATERDTHSQLYVSLPNADPEAFRLPVSSVKVYETMAKIAASERLGLRTWAGSAGPEISPALSERELAERNRIGAFLKSYVVERLRDPETRALNSSPAFRDARAALFKVTTPEALGRTATELLRNNERHSEEWRKHYFPPQSFPPPAVLPLNRQERDLLFAGRAPSHHTSEMRELRLLYGLSRQQRAARTAELHAGKLEPSVTLKEMLAELESRTTAKAVAHFQASLLNKKTNQASRLNLHELSHRLPPHERAFLYERSEARKQSFARTTTAERGFIEQAPDQPAQNPTTRAFGAAPKESPTFRAYLANMGRIERALLNEALQARGVSIDRTEWQQDQRGFSITEARQLLPVSLQKEIRLRARNEAWQSLVPADVFERHPTSAALRVSETIAHIQEHLQERASLAQAARDEFTNKQTKLHGNGKRPSDNDPAARQLRELNRYAAATREEVYRAFELLDVQRHSLALARTQEQSRKDNATSLNRTFPSWEKRAEPIRETAHVPTTSTAAVTSQPRKVEIHEREAMQFTASLRVPSERDWHIDSLQDLLKNVAQSVPDESREHMSQLPFKAERETR